MRSQKGIWMPSCLPLPSIRSKLFWLHYKAYERHLIKAQYKQAKLWRRLKWVAHFGFWLELEERSFANLDDTVLLEFDRHRRHCQCPGVTRERDPVLCYLRGFLRHVQANESVRSRPPPRVYPPLVQGFLAWMKVHRGVVETTLVSYGRYATELVEALGEDPSAYTAHGIREFVTARSRELQVKSAQMILTVVRMFLKHLAVEGLCRPDLGGAMPSIAGWRLQRLPLGLSDDEVEAILAACPDNPLGHRDRALILLMVRLGLRAGDVAKLCFSDLSFGEGKLRVCGKSQRVTWLPLPQDVGDAVLRYLREARPRVPNEYVFLRSTVPYKPFATTSGMPGSAISSRARVVLERAGIRRRPGGSHVFRHTAATQMLRRGVRLQGIAEILRHRSVSTTAIYAKVDQELLLSVAQPWPEVQPC